jgi:hypothetical protein
MPEQRTERPAPDQPLAEVLVAVSVRPAGHLRVVQVQAAETLEPDRLVEPPHNLVRVVEALVAHARGEQVLGVETDSEPGIAACSLEHPRELGEAAPERPTGTGGVLHQQPAAGSAQKILCVVERALQLQRDPAEHLIETHPSMAAQVQHKTESSH